MANPALQQLKDIHLPHGISTWPIAPGWVMLYVIIMLSFVYGAYICYRKRKEQQAINYAFLKLNELETLMKHNPDHINIAAELSTLIRRTAFYYFERNAIAGLTGENWLQFLNDSGHTTQFTEGIGQLLIDAPYRKNNHEDLAPLFPLIQHWLENISKTNNKMKK